MDLVLGRAKSAPNIIGFGYFKDQTHRITTWIPPSYFYDLFESIQVTLVMKPDESIDNVSAGFDDIKMIVKFD